MSFVASAPPPPPTKTDVPDVPDAEVVGGGDCDDVADPETLYVLRYENATIFLRRNELAHTVMTLIGTGDKVKYQITGGDHHDNKAIFAISDTKAHAEAMRKLIADFQVEGRTRTSDGVVFARPALKGARSAFDRIIGMGPKKTQTAPETGGCTVA